MTRYDRVLEILDQAIGGASANIGAHGPFWRGLTRDQFVAKKVFENQLLVVGHGSDSNLVKALKGETPFGSDLPSPPRGAKYPRMPDAFPPVSAPDIAFIQTWIEQGCPEDPYTSSPGAAPATQEAATGTMQWGQTKAPQASSRYDDVWFLDPQVGWAVNSNGQILHTEDGGESWVEQLHDPTVYLRCVAFASPSRGWVGSITEGKILYETRDGGRNWSLAANLPLDAPVAVCGMWSVSEAVLYTAGSNHPEQAVRMMRTTDGGLTWAVWDMRRWADNLIDVYFPTAHRGWVVGGRTDDPRDPNPAKPKLRPVVLYTEDGGRTWIDQLGRIRDQFPLGEWGWKIQFLDDRIGFISLQNYDAGAILTTTDGGASWIRRPINDPQMNANLEGIGFVDETNGWVGGWGDRPKLKQTSSKTLDGGLTWQDANQIGKTINRFRFFGKPVAVGYAAGKTVYKYAPASLVAAAVVSTAPPRRGGLFDDLEPLDSVGPAKVAITVPRSASRLTVRIWDPDGPLVRKLIDERQPATGPRVLTWDRTDDAGRLLAARSYLWRVTVDQISESKLVLVR